MIAISGLLLPNLIRFLSDPNSTVGFPGNCPSLFLQVTQNTEYAYNVETLESTYTKTTSVPLLLCISIKQQYL